MILQDKTLQATQPHPRHARQIAGAISLLILLSLGLQITIGEGSLLENAGGLARYFTIWSNIAACVLMGMIALGTLIPRPVMASLATALTVVGLVYWALLAADHHPVGLDRATNLVFHTFTPVAAIAWWLRYTPPSAAIVPALPTIMAPPLAYGAFAFILGEVTGFYAYFFLDLPKLGWGQFLLNNAVLSVFFALLGAGLLAVKRAVNRAT